MKSGMTYVAAVAAESVGAGSLMRRATLGFSTPAAPAGGSWAMTVSGGAGEFMRTTAPTSRPRRRSCDDGRALGLAGEVGDGDGLRAEAFDAADVPFAADDGAGRGGLGEDAAGGDFGAVEAVVDGHLDAEFGGFGLGLLRGEALEAGDFDLGSVDGEAHGDDGRGEGDEGEAEDEDYELEEAEHCCF